MAEQPPLPAWLDHPVFAHEVLGATLGAWTLAAALWVGLSAALVVVKWVVTNRLAALQRRHPTKAMAMVMAVLAHMRSWFLIAGAFYVALLLAAVPERFVTIAGRVAILVLLFQAVRWGGILISHWLHAYQAKRIETDPTAVTTMQAMAFLARLALWSVVLLLALENVGIDVTALIAGVGVAGIAIGLALQSVLGDLFASLAIVIDKPFVVGDFLIIDEFLGTVEHIGLKTTRLRSLSGEQVVFSNSDLLGSRIRNYKRMQERRVVTHVHLPYQTAHEDLARMPELLRDAVEGDDLRRFDRAHLKRFVEHAVEYELVYWIRSADYAVFMDHNQTVNLAIHRAMEEAGLAFAYPAQSLYLLRPGDEHQPAQARGLAARA